ncbi:MAG TPA: tripartite tricarboxylate transporter substrate binding protein [Burkholderiales bacterium]|jgi:tripartite-type tricarboxylate transporter receptor subunit TctC|nr:tripartite tricarboxylate transporter substrate binding protein [Burkholderiales bacterium]
MKGFLSGLFLLVISIPAPAQYPTKPVRMLVGFTPAGGVDITARLIAVRLTERWGKAVVVENRPGAAGNIATEAVARSAPDGYTLLMAFSSHASNAALYPSLPFDITRDFSSITLVATAPVLVVASLSAPAKTLPELIEYARAHPGAIRFASSGVGTPVHLGGELMMQLTGIRMTHIPYKGIAPAMTAMLAGETEITYAAVLSALQQLKGGKLRALALASERRYPGLPEVPTTAEAGLKGFEIDYWYALLGPAGIPPAIVGQIQRDVSAIVNAPETKESMLAQGSLAVGGTPEQLDALIRRDYALWSKVVKTGAVKPE